MWRSQGVMEGFGPMKLKRKDLEDVNDDFSDFSLSSPARKIRRLDAELPPIIEEEPEIPIAFEQPLLQDHELVDGSSGGLKIEELPSVPCNDEKAIVLFNPMNNNSLPRSLSNYSVSIDPNFVSAFQNQVPWPNQSNHWRLTNGETMENNNSNGCLAVVPWVPSQVSTDFPSETDYPDMMDAQETEEQTMDVEESTNSGYIEHRNVSGKILTEGFHQWQQQHCLIPQAPQNSTAPIVWYR